MNWRERHKLLIRLMTIGLSAWKSQGGIEFWITLSGVGLIQIINTGNKLSAHKLYVGNKFVCGADILYARLIGDWTDGMLQRIRRQMRELKLGEWKYVPGEDGRDSLVTATIDGDPVILHDCGMLFVNGLCVAKYEKQPWKDFTTYGPKLRRDLLRSPLSSWEVQNLTTPASAIWRFLRTIPDFGHVEVCSPWGTAKEANLKIEGKFVAPASELFRYLSGQWSWSQKRQLARRLISFNGEGWQLHGALSEHGAYLSRELDGDKVKVYESGGVFVHDKQIMTSPRLYQALHRQAIWCDIEHRDDLT